MERRKFFGKAALAGVAAVAALPLAHQSYASSVPSNGFVDVTDSAYGADPTGVASSATAFSLAIADAQSQGKGVYVPSGTYDLQSLAPVTAGDIEIIGAGRQLVTLTGSNNNAFIYLKNNGSLKISGIKAVGFKIFIQYLQNYNTDHLEIQNCEFENIVKYVVGSGDGVNFQNIGTFLFNENIANGIGDTNGSVAVVRITADDFSSAIITGNIVKNIGNTTKTMRSYAFHLRNSANNPNPFKTTITNNLILGVRSNSTEDTVGIMVLGGQTIIEGNQLENIISSNTSTTDNEGIYIKCRNSLVSTNTLKNCGGNEGVIMIKGLNRDEDPVNSTSSAGYENIVSNNTILQTIDIGIRTTAIHITMDGCMVTNNHISGTFRGIAIKRLTKNLIISTNLIYGLTHYGTNETVFGISINAPHDIQILDNQISNMESNGVCYGIYINSSSATSYSGCLIRGNWLNGLTSSNNSLSRALALNLNANDNCEKMILESNHINNASWGILAYNIDRCNHSAILNNSFANNSSGTFSPSTGWSVKNQI